MATNPGETQMPSDLSADRPGSDRARGFVPRTRVRHEGSAEFVASDSHCMCMIVNAL